jgi:hypothetical protein
VTCGVRELRSAFQAEAQDDRVAELGVDGNVDDVDDGPLAELDRPFARSLLNGRLDAAKSRTERLAYTPQVVSRLEDVVEAAVAGRVRSLLVDCEREV